MSSSLSATSPIASSVQLAALTFILIALSSASVLAKDEQEDEASEQVKQLSAMMQRRPVIKLNANMFQTFVGRQSFPREYSFVLMMNALSPLRKCDACLEAAKEFEILAESFMNSPQSQANKLFFGLVDFDESSEIFHELDILTAPCILYFDSKADYRAPEKLGIQQLGFGAEMVSMWVRGKTGFRIVIKRPTSIVKPIMLSVLVLTVLAILYFSRNSLDLLLDRKTWAFASVAMVFAMTSGQMWNQIRGAPLVQYSRSQMIIINNQTNAQFVLESYLVMLMNASIAIGMMLVTGALRNEGAKHKVFSFRAGIFMLTIAFGLLLSTFRLKSPSYPYSLLF